MTPPARHAAAIDVLDRYIAGENPEKLLTGWGRSNRYAGSKDRAAIRDLVFDIIRKRRSCTALGGVASGRGLVLGYLRYQGRDADEVFTGEKYAPSALSDQERAEAVSLKDCRDPICLDYQDWLDDDLRTSLGAHFEQVMRLMQGRAPVFIRVNTRRASRDQAVEVLAADQITAKPHPLAETALEITENPRKLAQSRAYLDGLIELQDVASQAVVAALSLPQMGRILDYCAGGGGKSLAIAARSEAQLFAYDVDWNRMRDLPARSKRAGVKIKRLSADDLTSSHPFDFVLCDVPCSGSGAWRRSPAGKFSLTHEGMENLLNSQSDILDKAAKKVSLGGRLAYSTCSLFQSENAMQINRFLKSNRNFELCFERQFLPTDGGDGLFVAELKRV